MKVSQVLHKMERGELVHIFDSTKPIDNNTLYEGEVRGVKRDDPVNGKFVTGIWACGYTLVLDVAPPKRRSRA
jgi:hypothetical protein